MELITVARLRSGYTTKFGTPRQSGLIDATQEVVFEPDFKDENMLRGIMEYSHLWLIWGFDRTEGWTPTVRPPRLGGNKRVGVFSTRSPRRPNPIGLTLVRLDGVRKGKDGTLILDVRGADIVDGTPIYDIKPYLPYVESISYASGGFSESVKDYRLTVRIPENLRAKVDVDAISTISDIISSDPRPGYHEDEDRVYAFEYGGYRIRFTVSNGVAEVKEIEIDG